MCELEWIFNFNPFLPFFCALTNILLRGSIRMSARSLVLNLVSAIHKPKQISLAIKGHGDWHNVHVQ